MTVSLIKDSDIWNMASTPAKLVEPTLAPITLEPALSKQEWYSLLGESMANVGEFETVSLEALAAQVRALFVTLAGPEAFGDVVARNHPACRWAVSNEFPTTYESISSLYADLFGFLTALCVAPSTTDEVLELGVGPCSETLGAMLPMMVTDATLTHEQATAIYMGIIKVCDEMSDNL